MPTHVHFIIHMEGNVEKPVTLGNIIGTYKSLTKRAWLDHIKSNGLECSGIIWHRNYAERRRRGPYGPGRPGATPRPNRSIGMALPARSR